MLHRAYMSGHQGRTQDWASSHASCSGVSVSAVTTCALTVMFKFALCCSSPTHQSRKGTVPFLLLGRQSANVVCQFSWLAKHFRRAYLQKVHAGFAFPVQRRMQLGSPLATVHLILHTHVAHVIR